MKVIRTLLKTISYSLTLRVLLLFVIYYIHDHLTIIYLEICGNFKAVCLLTIFSWKFWKWIKKQSILKWTKKVIHTLQMAHSDNINKQINVKMWKKKQKQLNNVLVKQ
jgi:hypothetical protein